ncbi:run domain Beclin-1-interacting and cysteine-rich domain-containing protein isoform X14 [Canis lupus baileyi]|uniref:run domain Beclin-1-interacting and cysteine-rich domain-containing protein isoform X13 n=1 Tax=Canis lupus familiaris TaxID=9615 RepID=UPI00004BF596|nr:run domain Beclin-1-interacting and cysteine-rich domain-containing protein isoform X13 [Canis lupus familiaris]XP_025330192.1 run domain Beclin-1-interacting and cysteine-rich domain-containing protein isoform X13 [Canis lupus dingo]XP_038301161.1 run domain Beclin-1-interacting and cysteine-rich domain-containing protein isoform X13 [Canis lupus familiaris]XP_038439034.1 run domain Beclin-1-interacting and cysteine-rich domain-containing protein isoform X13 [Canis lupus familiaris]
MRPEGAGMDLGGCEERLPEASRREHWQLLGNLKTTVEGLVSANSPNVWSKYGGLERLCRDMQSILYHGLIHDQVCCRQTDYWQFVKDIRWLSPHSALHVEKFISLHENSQSSTDGVSEHAVAELWLQHSLQCHCLSAQLRPLLGDKQYIRKFYTDTAFLLSNAHVTAMLQCLEAVEQNNPRLLAQIDASMFARKHESPLLVTKSQSLTALPGSTYTPPTSHAQHSYFGSFSSLYQSVPNHGSERRSTSFSLSGPPRKPQESREHVSPAQDQAFQASLLPVSALARDSSSTPNEMSSSTLTSPLEASLVSSQNDSPSDASEGPEYLAIGNLDPRGRTASCQSHSSNAESSSSNLFSSSSSQKPDSAASSLGEQEGDGQSQLSSILRRSSFSEGQTLPATSGTKKSHTRSHSDTNIASRGAPGGPRNITIIVEDPIAEGGQYLCSGEGMFRRPSEGQSLISYLSEQDFGSCADLEKENAHFSISESLIAAIELMKCNMMSQCLEEEEEEEEDSDREIQELKQKIRLRRQQIRTKNLLPVYQETEHGSFRVTSSSSQFSSRDSTQFSDSGSADEVDEFEIQDADIRRSTASHSKSFTSSQPFSHCFLHSTSAEAVAMGLLKQFEGMQLPAASELEWLVPEHDAPQKLLPIPDSLPISPDDGQHADIYKLRIRVRGNLEWAPPRPQIIFNVHPAPTRKIAVAKQNYRCAGCGIRTDPDYIKRLRYCEYLGKYFCQCCHENAQVVIPSRVLRKWDFSKYYVSNFSKDLLIKIWNDPLFNVQDINSALYRKVKLLNQVRLLRIQLYHMKNMFKTCRLAKELLDSFDTVPGHLTEDLHLYSLNDLTATRKGELGPRLAELTRAGAAHVERCMLCQAKGFICEFCQNEEDIIFPFELHKCRTCEECKACYHKACFKSGSCPRCERLQARRELLAKQSLESYMSDYEEEPTEALALEATVLEAT